MISPCYECPERKLYCHDRCEQYLQFKTMIDTAKKENNKHHLAVSFLREQHRKRERKARLRKKK